MAKHKTGAKQLTKSKFDSVSKVSKLSVGDCEEHVSIQRQSSLFR